MAKPPRRQTAPIDPATFERLIAFLEQATRGAARSEPNTASAGRRVPSIEEIEAMAAAGEGDSLERSALGPPMIGMKLIRQLGAGAGFYWQRVPVARPWEAFVRVVDSGSRPAITDLVVSLGPGAKLPENGLSYNDLRTIRLAAVSDAFEQDLAAMIRLPDRARAYLKEGPPKRGKHRSDDQYADVAVRYLRALKRDPRRPLAAMEKQFLQEGNVY